MARKPSKRTGASAAFVLDCSVALAWFFADEASEYADAAAASLEGSRAVVPSVWPLEVANCLVVGERRKRCTEAQSTAFLDRLATLPISIAAPSLRGWSEITAVARRYALSAYDAAYLELAMRRSLPLATLDAKLIEAARFSGAAVFRP